MDECIICLNDITNDTDFFYTKCCNKPIHNICMYNWIYNNNIDYNIHQCIYCRNISNEVILEISNNTMNSHGIINNNEIFIENCKKKSVSLINCFSLVCITIIFLYWYVFV